MPDESRRPWIIAHRGASHDARENTIEAFREARRLGADAVELDARRTADLRVVVHHDAAVAGGPPLVQLTRAAISARYPWIPDLDDAVAACEGMWVNVEIKNSPLDPDWDPTQQLAEFVAVRLGMRDDIVVSSFNPAAVARCAELAPQLARGLLVSPHTDPDQLAGSVPLSSIHVDHRALDEANVGRWRRRADSEGWWLLAFTVDDRQTVARLAASGVDGIITNNPRIARSALRDDGDS